MAERRAMLLEIDGTEVPVIHKERVAQAVRETIAGADLERLSLLYKALGASTRLKILMALRGGEMCVYDLAAFVGVSESAVSHQLRRFRELSLVKSRRDGQTLYYSLDDEHVSALLEVGLSHIKE